MLPPVPHCYSHGLGLVEKYRLLWCQASESASDLPNWHYAARPCATCQAWHKHVGVTTVGRPNPRVFLPSVSATSSIHAGDSNSCPRDMELCYLTKWLASRMLVWVSKGFFTMYIKDYNTRFIWKFLLLCTLGCLRVFVADINVTRLKMAADMGADVVIGMQQLYSKKQNSELKRVILCLSSLFSFNVCI